MSILVGMVINVLQNRQPIILYFLGTNDETALFSLQLPLGIWVVLFLSAGIISSLLIQILSRSPRSLSPRASNNPRSRKEKPPETPYSRPEPKKSDWDKSPPPEWENSLEEEDDEWDIEEPPLENTIPRQPSMVEDKDSEFEVKKPPKTSSQEGTVYSYTYRELSDRVPSQPSSDPPESDKKPSSSQQSRDVYDAQYRIITPPYQPLQDTQDGDEQDEGNWI
ncbi:LapA family protein [Crocosphaera sp. Alani8]|uniref:LapA family protein n=1 Tax=Crocosphaera sp. Alani8 TaxID=3038952 RepID=UPI00313DC741